MERSSIGLDAGSVVPASCDSNNPLATTYVDPSTGTTQNSGSHFSNDCVTRCPTTGALYDPYFNPGGCPPAPPTACTVSPASVGIGSGVQVALDPSDAAAYISNGLGIVTEVYAGSNPVYDANPTFGGWGNLSTTHSISTTPFGWSIGKQYVSVVIATNYFAAINAAGFATSDYRNIPGIAIKEEHCTFDLGAKAAATGACGSASRVTSSSAPNSNLCNSGSASSAVLMCDFYSDADGTDSIGPCGSFGPKQSKYDHETTIGWEWACGSVSCTAPYSATPITPTCSDVTFEQPCSIAPANGIPAGRTVGTALFTSNTCTGAFTYVSGCSVPVPVHCADGGPPVCNPACLP